MSRQFHPIAQLPPWRFAALTLGTAIALALLNTLQAGVELAYRGQDVPWRGLLKASTAEWLDYALFVFPLWALVQRYPVRTRAWRMRLPLYLGLGALVALAKECIYVVVGNFFRPGVFDLETILSEDFSTELLISWSLIGLLHAVAFHKSGGEPEVRADVAPPAADTPAQLDHVAVRGRAGHALVPVADIEIIASEGNYVRIETQNGNYLIRHTLTGIEGRLDKRFLRIHRRILINLDHVAGFEPGHRGDYTIGMRSGRKISSARSFNADVRSALGMTRTSFSYTSRAR